MDVSGYPRPGKEEFTGENQTTFLDQRPWEIRSEIFKENFVLMKFIIMGLNVRKKTKLREYFSEILK